MTQLHLNVFNSYLYTYLYTSVSQRLFNFIWLRSFSKRYEDSKIISSSNIFIVWVRRGLTINVIYSWLDHFVLLICPCYQQIRKLLLEIPSMYKIIWLWCVNKLLENIITYGSSCIMPSNYTMIDILFNNCCK